MKLWIEKELFQWEKQRYVHISLSDTDPEITFIQFYNDKSGSSPEIPLNGDKIQIPDYLLKESLPIMAVACTGQRGETQVVGRRQFKVIKRVRPDSYFDTSKHIVYDGGEEI